MKIYEELLAFRGAIVEAGGRIVRITLDREGNKALRNELEMPLGCSDILYGIVIDQAKECPVCGQEIDNTQTERNQK
ncbi:hypothetical protein LCGC14_2825030 [marine sediment metagenome]|uniref:Uncharacterized protein n=1 Tax=marine sediment metagenome TaxID=412755 RepID=A0A0F8YFU7_9ZZZZ